MGDPASETLVDLPVAAEVRVHVHPPPGEEPMGEHGVAGRVRAIERDGSAYVVDLDPVGRFSVVLPDRVPLPFGVGERVAARSTLHIAGNHPVREGSVVTPASEVLVACSDTGDASFLHRWVLDIGPVARRGVPRGGLAPRHDHWVVLGHGGRRAWLRDRRFAVLSCDDGDWLLAAEAWRFEPGLPIPSGAADGQRFSVVRLPESAAIPTAPPTAPRHAPDALPAPFANTEVEWRAALSVFVPYQATVEGATWVLRLNDFPAEPMYTLFVEGREIGSLDDWPRAWSRPSLLGQLARRPLVPWAADIAKAAKES